MAKLARGLRIGRWQALSLLALALVVLVVGNLIVVHLRTDPAIATMQQFPIYSAVYPHAVALAYLERSSNYPSGGTEGALVIRVFAIRAPSSDTFAKVVAWYAPRLKAQGWYADDPTIGPWSRPCYAFDLDPFVGHYQLYATATPPFSWFDPQQYALRYEISIERTCLP